MPGRKAGVRDPPIPARPNVDRNRAASKPGQPLHNKGSQLRLLLPRRSRLTSLRAPQIVNSRTDDARVSIDALVRERRCTNSAYSPAACDDERAPASERL